MMCSRVLASPSDFLLVSRVSRLWLADKLPERRQHCAERGCARLDLLIASEPAWRHAAPSNRVASTGWIAEAGRPGPRPEDPILSIGFHGPIVARITTMEG